MNDLLKCIPDIWAQAFYDFLDRPNTLYEIWLDEQGEHVEFPRPDILQPWIRRVFGRAVLWDREYNSRRYTSEHEVTTRSRP